MIRPRRNGQRARRPSYRAHRGQPFPFRASSSSSPTATREPLVRIPTLPILLENGCDVVLRWTRRRRSRLNTRGISAPIPRPSGAPTATTPNMPFSPTRLPQHTHAGVTRLAIRDCPHPTAVKLQECRNTQQNALPRSVSAQRVRRSAHAGDRVRAPWCLFDDARGRTALAHGQCHRRSCLLECLIR